MTRRPDAPSGAAAAAARAIGRRLRELGRRLVLTPLAGGGGDSYEPRRAREPVPDFKGEPMWADNRRHTAQENAKYHCDKSGRTSAPSRSTSA